MKTKNKIDLLSDIFGEKYYVEELEKFNIYEDFFEEKTIFIDFSTDMENQSIINKNLIEQLEIAGQILVNDGFSIIVYGEDTSRSFAEYFAGIFKNKNVKLLDEGNKKNTINSLKRAETIICFSKKIAFCALFFGRPFIYLNQTNMYCSNYPELDDFYLQVNEKFNAGLVVEKIKGIKENYNLYKSIVGNILNQAKYDEERIQIISNEEYVNKKNKEQMQAYMKQFKKNIEMLVEQGLLKDAKQLLDEYEKIVPDDVDIYSIRGVIAMIEGDLDEAEKVFKEGIVIEPLNQDILYNIAVLCENQKRYIDAFIHYNKLLNNKTICENMVNEIESKLNNLLENDVVKQHIKHWSNLRIPAITVETWVYNADNYLVQCIESVLNQSFEDFEWVIIDNGSTDNSTEILEKYAAKDKRIKLFRNEENTFVYKKPMNRSFVEYTENLSSEYWCMLDSDDYLHRDFLKQLYTTAKRYDVDVVVGGTEMFKEENEEIKALRCPPDFFTNDIKNLGDIFPHIYGCFRPIWGKLFKVSTLKKQLEYNKNNLKFLMTNAADTIFCIDFLKHCNSVAAINKPLHYYRIRQNSAYNSMVYKKRYLDYVKIYDDTKLLLQSWGKLSDQNLNFITSVLYYSLKDCIDVAVNSDKASQKEKMESIIAILSDKRVRHLLNQNGEYIILLDECLNALNCIIQ